MPKDTLIKVIKIGLYLLLFTPFLFYRTFIFPFITLKVTTFQILVELILIFWLALVIFYKETRPARPGPRLNLLALIFLIFLGVLFITSLFGVDFSRSFWSTIERQQGLFFLAHLFVFFLILSSFFEKKWIKIENYFLVSFAISLVAAAFLFVQMVNPQFFFVSSGERPGSFFGNPIFLASYLLFHVFIGLYLTAKPAAKPKTIPLKTFYIGGCLFLTIAIFLTETRGAILGFFVALLFLIFYALLQRKNILLRKISLITLIFIVLAGSMFWLTKESSFWKRVPGFRRVVNISFSNLLASDIAPRLLSWQIALKSFSQKPISGWGFENYKYAVDKNFNPVLLRYGFGETYWDKPHNVFLEYLANTGIIGFLAYLSIFVVAFYFLFLFLFRRTRINTDKNTDKHEYISENPFSNPYGSVLMAAALIAYLVQNFFVFDTFGSYLGLILILAFISSSVSIARINTDKNADKHGYISKNPCSYLCKSVFVLLSLFLIFLVFINSRIVYANKKVYWGINYFINSMPEQGLASFRKSLLSFSPYVSETRRFIATTISQAYEQDILPEPEKNVQWGIDELQKAIQEKPNDYFLKTTLVDILATVHQLDSTYLELGERTANEALALSPNRQQNYYALARIKILKGERTEAYKLLKKAVELDPMTGDPHFYYALLALDDRDYEKGLAELELAEKLGRYPRNLKEARVIADYLGDAENYQKAIEYYTSALRFDPEDYESHYKLGIVLYFEKNFEEARIHLKKALEIQPEIRQSPFYSQTKPILDELGVQ